MTKRRRRDQSRNASLLRKLLQGLLKAIGIQDEIAAAMTLHFGKYLTAAVVLALAFLVFLKGPSAVAAINDAGMSWRSAMSQVFSSKATPAIEQVGPKSPLIDVASPVDVAFRVRTLKGLETECPRVAAAEFSFVPGPDWQLARPVAMSGDNPVVMRLSQLPPRDLPFRIVFSPSSESALIPAEARFQLFVRVLDGFDHSELNSWRTDLLSQQGKKSFLVAAHEEGSLRRTLRIAASDQKSFPSIPILFHRAALQLPARIAVEVEDLQLDETVVVAFGETLRLLISNRGAVVLDVAEVFPATRDTTSRMRIQRVQKVSCENEIASSSRPDPEGKLFLGLNIQQVAASRETGSDTSKLLIAVDGQSVGAAPSILKFDLTQVLAENLYAGLGAMAKEDGATVYVNSLIANIGTKTHFEGHALRVNACQ
jgi:hypothetical protein